MQTNIEKDTVILYEFYIIRKRGTKMIIRRDLISVPVYAAMVK